MKKILLLSRCSKLIAIKLYAISEMHAKVRRESVAGYSTDETLACGPKEHTRWWQRYRGQLQGLLYRLILNSYLLMSVLAAFGAGAQGETFRNPVVWADVPDPDVIRVGDDFYLVSTTMHLMPGGPVMRSKDLVGWETVSYLFDTLNDTPKYDMVGGTVYGRGQWATSLRYHNGTFYALFSPNDEPYRSYVYKTDDPAKGWTLNSRLPHFHDSSLFFDDDGRVYVFSGQGRLNELTPDLKGLRQGGTDTTVIQRDAEENGLLEGSRVIKHAGKYYLLMISWPKDKPRRQLCYRADKITGPYEKKVILEDNFAGFPYVGQGTIVDDARGNWYGFIFQDRGAIGRVPTLMPCRWVDGWPMLGDADGRVPLCMAKPVQGYPDVPLVVSDGFDSGRLKINWQWNHNPVAGAWSLTERPGWLRLKTSRVAGSIYTAPNTVSQRMEGPMCSAYIEMDISNMKDGDRAGLAAFNGHSGLIGVEREGKAAWLTVRHTLVNMTSKEHKVTGVDDQEVARVRLKGKRVFLRIDGDFNLGRDKAVFYYSTDGRRWNSVGGEFTMRFDFTRLFMGTRYAIFNYATRAAGGYVDINKFVYHKAENDGATDFDGWRRAMSGMW